MDTVTYADMAARHGRRSADALLIDMERLAGLGRKRAGSDREARFRRAIEALCAPDFGWRGAP